MSKADSTDAAIRKLWNAQTMARKALSDELGENNAAWEILGGIACDLSQLEADLKTIRGTNGQR